MKLLVTAGPTREPIDAVRFISNRSSGKMGYAVASSALRHGHSVVLISGPVALPSPKGATIVKVLTSADMLTAVRANFDGCDALVMAAAVADWRPSAPPASSKIKKGQMPPVLPLEPTKDILMDIAPRKNAQIVVGFAAETDNMAAEAARKLKQKKLDMIVANNVNEPGAGFESDTNRVILFFAGGGYEELPLMAKEEVAERIISWIELRKNDSGTWTAGGRRSARRR